MPDWSYNTIFKPILFKMPAAKARDLTLNAMYAVSRMPFGRQLFMYMTNEVPEPALALDLGDLKIPSPVSCGIGFDLPGDMLDVFDTLGFGMIELGPVTISPCANTTRTNTSALQRQADAQTISEVDAPLNSGLTKFVFSLPKEPPAVPVFVRLATNPQDNNDDTLSQICSAISALPAWISGVTIDTRWASQLHPDFFNKIKTACVSRNFKFILCLAPDRNIDDACQTAKQAIEAKIDGISISGGIANPDQSTRTYGAGTLERSLQLLKRLREVAPDLFIIASGGIIEPADAMTYLKSGADIVQLYSGLVYSGPGLPKRINELYAHMVDIDPKSFPAVKSFPPAPPKAYSSPYSFASIWKAGGWLGFASMGAGVLISCSSAITVGLTSVILPYDEKFLGVTRDTMNHFNSNLLPFMSHDRVTYAGASISAGLLFIALAFFGARLGQRWAYNACLYSTTFAMVSSMMLFAFQYSDPLHMLVNLLLLPFWLWAVFAKPVFVAPRAANTHNTKEWQRALYGQLLFVGIGLGLLAAGATICYVGTHTVFVNEDLMFMHTTAQELLCHNAKLLPAIAHDRACFGATLVTAGVAVLGTALHGFRQGEGWVWWMLLISGLPGFVSTLAIHACIGYMSFVHLLPAYIASLMFVCGLYFSYKYLCVESAT